jgi:energy-coupling factor transporter ATP-binding protein EcfA2
LVELFDSEKYNTNMTVAENLLFGTPRDATFDIENLAQNEYVRRLLSETGLTKDFLIAGRRVAELMVELFADVAPGSELFEQFSFISADDLPAFRNVLARTAEEDVDGWTPDDRIMLLSLPFKLSPARHRLGLLDSQLRVRILEARRAFAEGVGGESSAVEFFDPDRYNSSISIQDNILFGRLAYGKARSAPQVGRLIREIVEKLNLRRVIMEVGLDYSVGIGGMRLSATLRQKLVLARAVLKRPDLLVIDEATSSLDGPSQDKIMANLLKELDGRGLIWVLHRASLAERFDYAMMLEGGRVVEQGRFQDLDKPGSIFNQLATAG